MRLNITISSLLFVMLTLPIQGWGQTQEDQIPSVDPRLNTKVNLDEWNITLQDLLAKVSQQTGVSLQVDSDKKAWNVRERRVHVLIKQMPLSSFQSTLKKLVNYSWKTEGDPKTCNYVMYQSEVDREREKKLAREQSQTDEQKAVLYKQGFERYRQALTLPPDQLAALQNTDPWSYAAANNPLLKAMYELLDTLPSSTLDSVISGGRFSVSYLQMTPEMKTAMRKLLQAGIEFDTKLNPSLNTPLTDELLESARLNLDPPDPSDTSIFAHVTVDTSLGQMVLIAVNPSSSLAKPFSEFMMKLMASQSPQEAQQLMSSLAPEVIEVLSPAQKYAAKPPKDPTLLKQVQIKPEDAIKSGEDYLRLIAKLTGCPVLCDQYGPQFTSYVVKDNTGKSTLLQLGGKQPVYQLLNILAKIMDRAWVKETDAILLTSNNWFLQRAGDVPQEWIDYLKNRVKTGMTLDDLALLAGGLNSEQINRTLGSYPELSSAVSLIKNNRSILKFYYSLTSAQRSRAYSTKGLSTSSLTQSQWQQAAQAFQSLRLGSDINTLMGGASIKVFNEHSNWSISLVTQDKQTIDNWINLPKPVVEKK